MLALAQQPAGSLVVEPWTDPELGIVPVGLAMAQHLFVFGAALVVSLLATPAMRWLALKYNIVDRPDAGRKQHVRVTAYLGGVAIFLGWIVGMACYLFFVVGPQTVNEPESVPLFLIIGALIIVVVGLIDDVIELSPSIKIAGQFAAAAALANQAAIVNPTGETVMIGQYVVDEALRWMGLSLPETASYLLGTGLIGFLVLGGCNAMNLLDGVDGLAAGVTSIASVGFLFIALSITAVAIGAGIADGITVTDHVRVALIVALLGALLGFLPYNFNPAIIFMGDAGSMLLGYLGVAIILQFANVPRGGSRHLVAGLIVFSLPIVDTSITMLRRWLRGRPLFKPGDQHVYMQLIYFFERMNLRRGLRVKFTVLTLYALGMVFAVLGCAMFKLKWWWVLAMYLCVCATVALFKHDRRPVENAGDAAGPGGPGDTQATKPPANSSKPASDHG